MDGLKSGSPAASALPPASQRQQPAQQPARPTARADGPTWSPVATRLSARVVGTPMAAIASLAMYSRIEERSTARPSAMRL